MTSSILKITASKSTYFNVRYICLRCGEYYDSDALPPPDGLCPRCENAKIRWIIGSKYAKLKKNGYIPASHRKRGRKAYISRMATLSHTDPERFKRLFNKQTPGTRAAITRRINQQVS